MKPYPQTCHRVILARWSHSGNRLCAAGSADRCPETFFKEVIKGLKALLVVGSKFSEPDVYAVTKKEKGVAAQSPFRLSVCPKSNLHRAARMGHCAT
jgi:hypothetical protein